MSRTLQNQMVKSQDDVHEMFLNGQQQEKISMQIQFIKSEYILNRCEKLSIPLEKDIPKHFIEFDFDDDFGNRKILTDLGKYYYIKLIQNENKIIREKISLYSTIIFGIIGMIIGLISIINNK